MMATKQIMVVGVAPFEHRFWVCNGAVLSTLEELAAALRVMNDADFLHHVNKDKNDFANWIGDVLHDVKLAAALRKVTTKRAMQKKLEARLAQ